MTDTPARSRNLWFFVMIACLVVAIVSAATLVVLLLTDDDEGVPDAIPIVGDDDDEDFERPVLEFTELEDGDTVPLEPQGIEVRVTHPLGVDSVQFYIEGTSQVLTATGGGSTDTTVQFPFVPEEPGEYTLVTEATAVDGTAAEPIDVTITVEPSDEPVSEVTPTATPG
jgi:hypothetical protein